MSTHKDNITSVSAWYLIYTKPRQEKTAKDHLLRQDYQIYLPFIQTQQHRQNRYQLVTEPMFPRYLFIYLSTMTDNWGPIRSTRGVTSLVQFGGVPSKVPSDFIDYLQQNENKNDESQSTSPEFSRGENIRILNGVMAGYEGIFEATTSAKRVTVLLDIVGKATRVELPVDSIGTSNN